MRRNNPGLHLLNGLAAVARSFGLRPRLRTLSAATAFFCLALPTHAIVELDSSFSVTDADYIALGTNANYTSVGFVSGPGTGGSGVLLTAHWVLTAAHIANAQTLGVSTFSVGGNAYTIDSRIIHPGYTNSPINNDIALLHLTTSVLNVTPATLYTGAGELGVTATWVGFGQTGTGTTGQNGTGGGTKRAATNIIDVFAYTSPPNILLTNNTSLGTFIVADFDDDTLGNNTILSTYGFASSPLHTSLEGSLAASDSGGGVFANIGGNNLLIGINDFIAPGSWGNNTQYGALAAATRVSAYEPWITSNIPEPGVYSVATGGFLLCLIWLRKRLLCKRDSGHRQRRV